MSAGTGIFHSEYNLENEETSVYQIWSRPKEIGITPKWGRQTSQRRLYHTGCNTSSQVIGQQYSKIHQNVRIFAGRVNSSAQISHPIAVKAYLLVAEGEVSLNDILAQKDDGVTINKEASVILIAKTDTEVLIIEVPGLEEAR